jgi:hypothetical protein
MSEVFGSKPGLLYGIKAVELVFGKKIPVKEDKVGTLKTVKLTI